MSEPIDPATHPDELLAGFVDGTATADERAAVESHVATCETCREELELAARARTALASLPELGAPGIADEGLAALRRSRLQPIPTPASVPAPGRETASTPGIRRIGFRARRFRLNWAAVGVAAAVVAVLAGVAVPLALVRGGANKTASGPVAAPAPAVTGPVPPVIDRGGSYTTDSLNALAAQVAGLVGERLGAARNSSDGAVAATPRLPSAPTASDLAIPPGQILQCVENGGGVPGGASPVYLERATVNGVPAYVGGFLIPNTKLNVMLVAVSQQGCQPLYSVRQSA